MIQAKSLFNYIYFKLFDWFIFSYLKERIFIKMEGFSILFFKNLIIKYNKLFPNNCAWLTIYSNDLENKYCLFLDEYDPTILDKINLKNKLNIQILKSKKYNKLKINFDDFDNINKYIYTIIYFFGESFFINNDKTLFDYCKAIGINNPKDNILLKDMFTIVHY